jgi:hypothetical protein
MSLDKRNEGKLEAQLSFSRTNEPVQMPGEPVSDSSRLKLRQSRSYAVVVLVAWHQPVGSIGKSAQRHLLKSLVLGQGRGLVGLLDRLIHNDTSMVGWLRWER